ncbi:MAG: hypothetical protein QXU95_04460 [Candidatus Bathyarchaeia archaeon]
MEVKVSFSEAVSAIKRAESIEPKAPIALSSLRWKIYASLQNILNVSS